MVTSCWGKIIIKKRKKMKARNKRKKKEKDKEKRKRKKLGFMVTPRWGVRVGCLVTSH